MAEKKTCFVITGFGRKTDFQTGMAFDLEKTYQQLIKPAFEELGFECFRTVELKYSGSIDTEMYNYILKADFAVADISTLNANAIYELGVRHALRPHTTIIIAESSLLGDRSKNIDARVPFDLNHNIINFYKHDGGSINEEEATRFKKVLKDLASALMDKQKNDSPVYTFLPGLVAPVYTETERQQLTALTEKTDSLADLLAKAEDAKKEANYPEAFAMYEKAMQASKGDSYITQRYALLTYKSKQPTEKEALEKALQILKPLNIDVTNDTETLGLAGAIYKRLYDSSKDPSDLKNALKHYQRGYYIGNDYYTGVNTAFIYNVLASISTDNKDRIAYTKLAEMIRTQVLEICTALMKSKDANKREDFTWILQTKAECEYGLGKKDACETTIQFIEMLPNPQFNRQSFDEQMGKLQALINL